MKDLDSSILIEFLRKEVIRLKEIEGEGFEKREKPDFSRGYNYGRQRTCEDVLREIAKSGVTIEPDLSLIAEAENLISKYPGSFYCGHELNRMLHHYKADFNKKDYSQAMLSEICIRRGLVKARIESLKYVQESL